MAGITFTESSGVNDSIFGKSQAPIRMFLEKRAEAFEAESALPHLFNISTSKNWAEKFTSLTSMEGFKPVGENGSYPVDEMQESFSKTLEHMVWKDSFPISREMIDDEKNLNLSGKPLQFIQGYHRSREKLGAQLFGSAIQGIKTFKINGKTFDATCADKQSLFCDKHPSFTGKGAAQSNRFTDEFSNDVLLAMESAMQDFRDDNGEVLNITPDTIVIPNDYRLKKAVFAAIGADKDPNSAAHGFNYNFGRWNVIVWPYLNQFIEKGTTPYMLCASEHNKDCGGAIWLDRIALEVNSTIAENDANVWKGYTRFSAGFNDWRAFAVGGVSGGTQLIKTT